MRRWEYRTQMFVFEIFSTMLDMRNWIFELMHREQLEHFDDLAAVSIAAARPALPRSWDVFQAPSQTRMRHCAC